MTATEMLQAKSSLLRRIKHNPDKLFKLYHYTGLDLDNDEIQDLPFKEQVNKAIANESREEFDSFLKRAELALVTSEIVFWKKDIALAAWAGNDVFNGHQVPDDIWALSSQLWICPPLIAPKEGRETVLYVLLIPDQEKQELAFLTMAHFPDDNKWLYWFQDLTVSVGDILVGEWINTHLYAMLEFTKLPFVTAHKEPGNRNTRRQAEREELPEQLFRFIHLRHPQRKETQDEGTGREFSCQWIVGGHWRKQWYPSEQKHKPVYILPYIKGPDDQPLKSSPEKLYKVVR